MDKTTFRAAAYRAITKDWVKPAISSWIFSDGAKRERIFSELVWKTDPTAERNTPIGWFHASSVGELEMLVPVIEQWSRFSTGEGQRFASVITIFSESAEGTVEKLAERLRESGADIRFAGYSPWEGEWDGALARVNPSFVMTARYEAWPELWMSLGIQDIPLFVIGAQARSSLTWARRICAALGQPIPKQIFCTILENDIADLKSDFSDAEIRVTGDPRWERAWTRSQVGNVRARELISRSLALPKPWGVLGSAWKEDLELFAPVLKDRKGTLWIVPHKIDEAHVSEIEAVLKKGGLSSQRTRDAIAIGKVDALIVNEMGFLLELYSAADWAYVGGGFNDGIHNTIEPAIYGIPVACGPKNAERFRETALLSSSGQLQIVRKSEELREWLSQGPVKQPLWKEQVSQQLGASERVIQGVLPWVSRWQPRKN